MRNLTKAYFDQGTVYYSGSGEALIQIDKMPSAYAANAARRLLLDATYWAHEAQVDTRFAARWMLNTKLWRALNAQATK
jgi:hypothetical protein